MKGIPSTKLIFIAKQENLILCRNEVNTHRSRFKTPNNASQNETNTIGDKVLECQSE